MLTTLNKISVEGYKSIRSCRDLTLGRLNVLIGANNSGKSNFLSFFRLLEAAMGGELQTFVGREGAAHSLLHFGTKVTQEINGSLEFDSEENSSNYACRLIYAAPDNLIFASETFRNTPKPGSVEQLSNLIARGSSESAVIQPGFRDNERLKWFASHISDMRAYHFHDTSLVAGIRGRWRIHDHRRLYSNGENLAAILRFLRDDHPKDYFRIIETVRLIAPMFAEFLLIAAPSSPELVMLDWRARGFDYQLGPHQLSDGTLRFIALATLLLQPKELLPQLIVIDEPELGLHPLAIKILTSLLKEASESTQLLIATQSAALIDEVDPADVIVAETEDGATSLKRLDSAELSEWLKDYTLSQIWESNLFGGRP